VARALFTCDVGTRDLKEEPIDFQLQKHEFGNISLIYIGHMIRGGEIRLYLENIESITQFIIPTSVTKVKRFMISTQYLRNFIVKFSKLEAPLHALTTKGKIFHWGNTKQREFEDLKKNTGDARVLAMPNFSNLLSYRKILVDMH
jgi:hypothetical protein